MNIPLYKGRKLRILYVAPNEGGCAYYRVLMPMAKLQEKYGDQIDIRRNDDPLDVENQQANIKANKPPNLEDMEWADVIFTCNIHKYGGQYNVKLVQTGREMGKFLHFDTDDLLTDLYEGHRHYDAYKENKLDEVTKFVYGNCDLVTVTQLKFADRVAKYCRAHLGIIKNSIDFELPCWNTPLVPAPRATGSKKKLTRIGWVGGIHHEEDVKEIHNVMLALNAKIGVKNLGWYFYGRPFVPPGTDAGKDQWMQDVWDNYERILRFGARDAQIRIGHALPAHQYGSFYANMDLSIAPLQPNNFNDSKSEIKLMECGRYGVPLVCTDVGCYSEVIENGKTGYLISKANKTSDWKRAMTRLIKDPDHRRECGENLKKIVDERFDINKTIHMRAFTYIELLNKRDEHMAAYKKAQEDARKEEEPSV